MIDSSTLTLLGPPLAAAALVIATHVLLGREVLARGIIFIDLAMAQVAALGMLAATLWGDGAPAWLSWACAIGAVLSVAAALAWSERHFAHLQEPLIGCVYVVAASAALLLLAQNPHGTEQLNQLLAGQLLWVDWDMLWPVALLYAGLLALWFAGLRRRPAAFYFVFAFAVTAAVHLVGVLLVFATLILPALAVSGLRYAASWLLAYGLAAGAYMAGLWLSVALDLPAGPLIVCLLAALALLTGVGRQLFSRPTAQ